MKINIDEQTAVSNGDNITVIHQRFGLLYGNIRISKYSTEKDKVILVDLDPQFTNAEIIRRTNGYVYAHVEEVLPGWKHTLIEL